jgi:hypothetical protein
MLSATSTNVGSLMAYTSVDISTSSPATTTPGIFSRNRTNSTSTISVGDQKQGVSGCLEIVKEGAYVKCYINSAGTGIECAAGRCN